MPKPGQIVHQSLAYNPPVLKGIKVDDQNPFRFEFVLDKGDNSHPDRTSHSEQSEESHNLDSSSLRNTPQNDNNLKTEANKLIKYFLAALTVPEKDLWVNLSPYEKDRIIPDAFGKTEMGRDLLAQDYILKQITASLMYPEDEVGKKFWKRVYEESARKFGNTNIPVNTFNKVWIVPEKAVVYENVKNGIAYVVESKLKVMLEEDYLSLSHQNSHPERSEGSQNPRSFVTKSVPQDDVRNTTNQIVRQIIIPQLYKEINEGQNFAQLRQVYNSLILATWYKKKLKNSILAQIYADKNKVIGLSHKVSHSERSEESQKQDPSPSSQDDTNVEAIYQNYLHSFKQGAYNFIKEEIDPVTKQPIPRKYFSGGYAGVPRIDSATIAQTKEAIAGMDNPMRVVVNLNAAKNQTDQAQVVFSFDEQTSGATFTIADVGTKNRININRLMEDYLSWRRGVLDKDFLMTIDTKGMWDPLLNGGLISENGQFTDVFKRDILQAEDLQKKFGFHNAERAQLYFERFKNIFSSMPNRVDWLTRKNFARDLVFDFLESAEYLDAQGHILGKFHQIGSVGDFEDSLPVQFRPLGEGILEHIRENAQSMDISKEAFTVSLKLANDGILMEGDELILNGQRRLNMIFVDGYLESQRFRKHFNTIHDQKLPGTEIHYIEPIDDREIGMDGFSLQGQVYLKLPGLREYQDARQLLSRAGRGNWSALDYGLFKLQVDLLHELSHEWTTPRILNQVSSVPFYVRCEIAAILGSIMGSSDPVLNLVHSRTRFSPNSPHREAVREIYQRILPKLDLKSKLEKKYVSANFSEELRRKYQERLNNDMSHALEVIDGKDPIFSIIDLVLLETDADVLRAAARDTFREFFGFELQGQDQVRLPGEVVKRLSGLQKSESNDNKIEDSALISNPKAGKLAAKYLFNTATAQDFLEHNFHVRAKGFALLPDQYVRDIQLILSWCDPKDLEGLNISVVPFWSPGAVLPLVMGAAGFQHGKGILLMAPIKREKFLKLFIHELVHWLTRDKPDIEKQLYGDVFDDNGLPQLNSYIPSMYGGTDKREYVAELIPYVLSNSENDELATDIKRKIILEKIFPQLGKGDVSLPGPSNAMDKGTPFVLSGALHAGLAAYLFGSPEYLTAYAGWLAYSLSSTYMIGSPSKILVSPSVRNWLKISQKLKRFHKIAAPVAMAGVVAVSASIGFSLPQSRSYLPEMTSGQRILNSSTNMQYSIVFQNDTKNQDGEIQGDREVQRVAEEKIAVTLDPVKIPKQMGIGEERGGIGQDQSKNINIMKPHNPELIRKRLFDNLEWIYRSLEPDLPNARARIMETWPDFSDIVKGALDTTEIVRDGYRITVLNNDNKSLAERRANLDTVLKKMTSNSRILYGGNLDLDIMRDIGLRRIKESGIEELEIYSSNVGFPKSLERPVKKEIWGHSQLYLFVIIEKLDQAMAAKSFDEPDLDALKNILLLNGKIGQRQTSFLARETLDDIRRVINENNLGFSDQEIKDMARVYILIWYDAQQAEEARTFLDPNQEAIRRIKMRVQSAELNKENTYGRAGDYSFWTFVWESVFKDKYIATNVDNGEKRINGGFYQPIQKVTVDRMLRIAQQIRPASRPKSTFVELGAGSALGSFLLAKAGETSIAIELNEDYVRQQAQKNKLERIRGLDGFYISKDPLVRMIYIAGDVFKSKDLLNQLKVHMPTVWSSPGLTHWKDFDPTDIDVAWDAYQAEEVNWLDPEERLNARAIIHMQNITTGTRQAYAQTKKYNSLLYWRALGHVFWVRSFVQVKIRRDIGFDVDDFKRRDLMPQEEYPFVKRFEQELQERKSRNHQTMVFDEVNTDPRIEIGMPKGTVVDEAMNVGVNIKALGSSMARALQNPVKIKAAQLEVQALSAIESLQRQNAALRIADNHYSDIELYSRLLLRNIQKPSGVDVQVDSMGRLRQTTSRVKSINDLRRKARAASIFALGEMIWNIELKGTPQQRAFVTRFQEQMVEGMNAIALNWKQHGPSIDRSAEMMLIKTEKLGHEIQNKSQQQAIFELVRLFYMARIHRMELYGQDLRQDDLHDWIYKNINRIIPERLLSREARDILQARDKAMVSEGDKVRIGDDGPPVRGNGQGTLEQYLNYREQWKDLMDQQQGIFESKGQGNKIVLIGPGYGLDDLQTAVQFFGAARAITVIDKVDLRENIEDYKELKRRQGIVLPVINFIHQDISKTFSVADDLKEADLVLAFNVFDARYFSGENLQRAQENIFQLLKPGGSFIKNESWPVGGSLTPYYPSDWIDQKRFGLFSKQGLGSNGKLGITVARKLQDAGMSSAYVSKGGIDLTSDQGMQVKTDPSFRQSGTQDDRGIEFKLDQAMLEQLQNAPGFVPVVISIQPLTNLPEFLGL